MKKILLTFIAILGMVSVANAQDAGQIWVGGSVGFSTSKQTDYDRTNNYQILPEIGYILSENWGIGISLGYLHYENSYKHYSSNDSNYKRKQDGFRVNPFVRYSFLKGDIGGMFVDGGVSYMYNKYKYTNNTYEDQKNNFFEVGFRPGVAINVSNKVALTAKYGFIGYQHNKWDDDKTNTFSLDFDFRQASFGVNFIF